MSRYQTLLGNACPPSSAWRNEAELDSEKLALVHFIYPEGGVGHRSVIPAQAGIQEVGPPMDSGIRRNDGAEFMTKAHANDAETFASFRVSCGFCVVL